MAESSCPTGKIRYRDELAARIALAKLQRADRGQRRAYRCPPCRGWHLTSMGEKGGGDDPA
jgi:hypothetical protein